MAAANTPATRRRTARRHPRRTERLRVSVAAGLQLAGQIRRAVEVRPSEAAHLRAALQERASAATPVAGVAALDDIPARDGAVQEGGLPRESNWGSHCMQGELLSRTSGRPN